MRLTYIGYHQFQPNIPDLEADIRAADEDGKFVIVYPHWGNEYIRAPQANQRALAQIMVEAGADLIIGGHPHVPQGIEVIDDVLVVYSLGNFIFDQQIPETWQAMTVGVIIDEEEVELYLMPVYTKNSQPVPSSDEAATKLFAELADLSSESLQLQIQSGIITLPYER
jgi:poly-gamma-glutamate synthesis protein (capsule biosynthesis protein)